MAWPCISRVCCLARFWNQMDKSDLAVPLTIHNYSDIEEEEAAGGAATGGGLGGGGLAPQPPPKIPTGGSSSLSRSHAQPPPHHARGPSSAALLPASASAPSLQQHHHHQQQQEEGPPAKRPSKRTTPRRRPAAAETQYQQDFRAWPLQKRDALPWVGEARGRIDSPRPEVPAAEAAPFASHAGLPGAGHTSRVYVLPVAAEGEPVGGKEAGFKPGWPHAAAAASSSFSPPPGAAKIAAASASSSYRQEYRPWSGAKRSRPTKTTQGFIIPEDHFAPESSYKADFKIPEVKGKFAPNPSAVFQAPSRILNV
ncbi:MAP6 domain-containing protein 1 [Anolis carolinensis]|uniref:MAP6 domain-containing protein 1 n=1 Tax=Anolis carolinensis TaxID=28377 RepID=UPI002F2B5948